MRLFRRFTSGESQEVVARCPAFFARHGITVKKSLRAAERKRADVARARRCWIREQGFLDPAQASALVALLAGFLLNVPKLPVMLVGGSIWTCLLLILQ